VQTRTRSSGISRSWINFWLDALLLCLFCALMTVAMIVRFVFPPALDSHLWRLWGRTYDDWANLQFSLVAALALGILVHVMLHWSWVCGLIATRLARNKKAKVDDGLQTLYGVGFLILLLTLIGCVAAAAQLSIVRPEY
jgi:hypothetical protein